MTVRIQATFRSSSSPERRKLVKHPANRRAAISAPDVLTSSEIAPVMRSEVPSDRPLAAAIAELAPNSATVSPATASMEQAMSVPIQGAAFWTVSFVSMAASRACRFASVAKWPPIEPMPPIIPFGGDGGDDIDPFLGFIAV